MEERERKRKVDCERRLDKKTGLRENDRTSERKGNFWRDKGSERDRKTGKKLGRGREQIPK